MFTPGRDSKMNWEAADCSLGSTAIRCKFVEIGGFAGALSCSRICESTSRLFAVFPPLLRVMLLARSFSSSIGKCGTLRTLLFQRIATKKHAKTRSEYLRQDGIYVNSTHTDDVVPLAGGHGRQCY